VPERRGNLRLCGTDAFLLVYDTERFTTPLLFLCPQGPSNVRLTSEPAIGAKLARRSLNTSFVTPGESGSSGC